MRCCSTCAKDPFPTHARNSSASAPCNRAHSRLVTTTYLRPCGRGHFHTDGRFIVQGRLGLAGQPVHGQRGVFAAQAQVPTPFRHQGRHAQGGAFGDEAVDRASHHRVAGLRRRGGARVRRGHARGGTLSRREEDADSAHGVFGGEYAGVHGRVVGVARLGTSESRGCTAEVCGGEEAGVEEQEGGGREGRARGEGEGSACSPGSRIEQRCAICQEKVKMGCRSAVGIV